MSRTYFRKPEFRLAFDYPQITLTRADAQAPEQVFDLGSATLLAELRRLGGEIRAAGGRLTVVLPEGEVWRGRLPLGGARPRDRRQVARARTAEAMGLPAKALAIRFGRLGRDGTLPAAAVRRETLVETRGFLSRAGLRPARITGAGAFDGFASAPRLDEGLSERLRPALPVAGGLAAAVLVALLLRPDAAPPAVDLVGPMPLAETAAPEGLVRAAAVAELAPRRRPADLVRVAAAPEPQPAEARAPAALPAPVATAGLQIGAPVSMGSRSLPVTELPPPPVADKTLRLASLTFARARIADTVTALPLLPRPAAAPAAEPVETVRAAPPAAATPPAAAAPVVAPVMAPPAAAVTAPRPLRRPPAPAPVAEPAPEPAPAVAPAPAATAAAAGPAIAPPRARPQDEVVAEVSQAIATAVVTAGVESARQNASAAAALAASESLSTAALLTAARPEPRRAVAPVRQAAATPQRAAPAPTPQRVAAPQRTAAAQPARQAPQRVAAAQPARQVAQPVRQAQPTRQAAPRAAAAPQRAPAAATSAATAAAATERVGFSRRGMALIGVFGASRDRYAMVRLPNGDMQRVKPGDRIQGATIAAIGQNSVQLASGGRTTTLAMPN